MIRHTGPAAWSRGIKRMYVVTDVDNRILYNGHDKTTAEDLAQWLEKRTGCRAWRSWVNSVPSSGENVL